MAVTRANIPGIGQSLSLIYSCIPVANPLTTIIVIARYRNACIDFLKACLCPKWIASISYIPTEMSLAQAWNLNKNNNNIQNGKRNQVAQIQQLNFREEAKD